MKSQKLLLFFAALLLYTGCGTKSHVVNKSFVQKRKYTKGFHVKGWNKNIRIQSELNLEDSSVSDDQEIISAQESSSIIVDSTITAENGNVFLVNSKAKPINFFARQSEESKSQETSKLNFELQDSVPNATANEDSLLSGGTVLARRSFFALVGSLISEVIFTNITPIDFFSGFFWIWTLYFPLFFIMDYLAERHKLNRRQIFYMGSIFGIILEGILVVTITESPFFFLTAITTFWHGVLTTMLAFIISRSLFPSGEPSEKAEKWLTGTAVVLASIVTLFSLLANLPLIAAGWWAYPFAIGLGFLFWGLIKRMKKKGKTVKQRPWAGPIWLAIAFLLGQGVHSLDPTWSSTNMIIRLGIFAALMSILIINAIKKSKVLKAQKIKG